MERKGEKRKPFLGSSLSLSSLLSLLLFLIRAATLELLSSKGEQTNRVSCVRKSPTGEAQIILHSYMCTETRSLGHTPPPPPSPPPWVLDRVCFQQQVRLGRYRMPPEKSLMVRGNFSTKNNLFYRNGTLFTLELKPFFIHLASSF